jgi:hypothetical protein
MTARGRNGQAGYFSDVPYWFVPRVLSVAQNTIMMIPPMNGIR